MTELCLAARLYPGIVLLPGDVGYGAIEEFRDTFPERFFNTGITEQSTMSMAAGLASEGLHPFVYSIANFPTWRCAEQIRNDVAYHNFPVTIVAVGGGLAYGSLGYTHHGVQDYALMRCLPNMLIAAPGDPLEVRACVRYLCANPQPSYLRLGKTGEPTFHADVPEVEPGKWLCLRPGSDITYLTTGTALAEAFSSVPESLVIHSLPLWGMNWKLGQSEQVEQWRAVITAEDHYLDGGFGSWLLEAVRPSLRAHISLSGLKGEMK
jgi:transketolase